MSEYIQEQRRRRRHRKDSKKKYKTKTQWDSQWKTEEVDDFGTMEEMYHKYGDKDYIWWCAQCPPTRGENGEYNGYRLDGDEVISWHLEPGPDGKLTRKRKLTKMEWNLSRYKRHKAWIANFKISGKKVILVANAATLDEMEIKLIMAEMEKRGITWADYEPEIQKIVGVGADQWIQTATPAEVKRVLLKAVNRIAARKGQEPLLIVLDPRSHGGDFRTSKKNGRSWIYKRSEP